MNRPICVIAIIYILVIVGLHNLGVVFLDYNKVNIDSNKQYIGIIVDEKEEGELPEMVKDLTQSEVLWGTFLTLLILW